MKDELTNLMSETMEVLQLSGKAASDVLWVGSRNGKYLVSPSEFWLIAQNTNYDSSWGAVSISQSLVVVGDSWWLERHDYDGSEWWEFKEPPVPAEDANPFTSVINENHRDILA